MEHEKDGFAAAVSEMARRLCDSLQRAASRGRFWAPSRWPSSISVVVVTQLGRDFLPPFNEGSVQVNVLLPPGTSLATSNRIAGMVDERIGKIKGVVAFGRRTGRAELDEHAEGVNVSEIIISFDPNRGRSREEMLEEIARGADAGARRRHLGRAAAGAPDFAHALRRQGPGRHQAVRRRSRTSCAARPTR